MVFSRLPPLGKAKGGKLFCSRFMVGRQDCIHSEEVAELRLALKTAKLSLASPPHSPTSAL